MKALVLSTLPHLAAVPPAASVSFWYGSVALASSLCSAVWHGLGETPILTELDHVLAWAWAATELWFWPSPTCIGLQLLVFTTHRLAASAPVPYWVSHSIWHLLSAWKAIRIARAALSGGGAQHRDPMIS